MINERVKNESSTQELDKILWLKQARVYWSICCDFLDNSVLPHLAHLKPILLSEIGRRIIGHEDIDKLIELIDDVMSNKKSLSESNFSRLVKAIAEKPYLILSKENRNSYIANVEWFESRLLKPREESGKQSRLIKFLMQSPTPLGTVIKEVYEEYRIRLPENHKIEGLEQILEKDPLVFFARDWALEAIQELFENICKRIYPENAPISIWMNIEPHDTYIKFILKNNNTRVEGTGVGLDTLKKRLETFGGDLETEPRPDDSQSTFKVDLTFMQGN
jgi:hypothetical protein